MNEQSVDECDRRTEPQCHLLHAAKTGTAASRSRPVSTTAWNPLRASGAGGQLGREAMLSHGSATWLCKLSCASIPALPSSGRGRLPRSVPAPLQRRVQLSQAAGRTDCSCPPAHELDGGGLGGVGAARGDGRADQLAVHPAGLRWSGGATPGPHKPSYTPAGEEERMSVAACQGGAQVQARTAHSGQQMHQSRAGSTTQCSASLVGRQHVEGAEVEAAKPTALPTPAGCNTHL